MTPSDTWKSCGPVGQGRIVAVRWFARYTMAVLAGASTAVMSASDLSSLREARSVNEDTVGIVFQYEDVYRRMVDDMANELATNAGVRVVPVIGENHVQSIYDILYMNGIDLGIVHADVLEYIARSQGYPRIYQKINALAQLFEEKVAIIAGDAYESLGALAGQQVNLGSVGTGTDVSGAVLFETLGIDGIRTTRFDKLEALEKVKSGELAAMVYLIEEPVAEFRNLSAEDGVTLLPLEASEALTRLYGEAELTHADFPSLVDADAPLSTVSVSVMIASYNWPAYETWRYNKLKRFVDAFVANLDNLKTAEHDPAWQNVALQADIPGVQRLELVDTMIEDQRERERRLAEEEAALKMSELKAQQERLSAQLAERLGNTIGNATDTDELERMIERLQRVLGELE